MDGWSYDKNEEHVRRTSAAQNPIENQDTQCN